MAQPGEIDDPQVLLQLADLQRLMPDASRQRCFRMISMIAIQEHMNVTPHRALRLMDRIVRCSQRLTPDIKVQQLRPELEQDHKNDAAYTEAVRRDLLSAVDRKPHVSLRQLKVFYLENDDGHRVLKVNPEAFQQEQPAAPAPAQLPASAAAAGARLTRQTLQTMSQQRVAETATARARVVPAADCVQAVIDAAVTGRNYVTDWTAEELECDLGAVAYFQSHVEDLHKVVRALMEMKAEADACV